MMTIIDNINNGQIDRAKGTLSFSVNTVEQTVQAGTVYEGSFSVLAPAGELNEGYVYSDDYRMECLTDSFCGVQDEIAYRFDASKLLPGTDVHGSFILITNHGEYRIPFSMHTEQTLMDSSIGAIRNSMHFTNLAKAKWEEAAELFYDPGFTEILRGSDREYLTDYRCLSTVRGSAHNMDEFLVSIGKKTPVEYIASEKSVEINDPEGFSRFSLYITRNGWGYTHFEVGSEGDFLTLEEDNVSYDSFLGNKYQLYYYIDSEKLHSGHNFGAIIIKDDHARTVIPVTVNVGGSIRHLKDMTRFRHHRIIHLMELYADHRLKKISTAAWLADSSDVVAEMLTNDPEDLMAGLYQIHLLITREHINEAAWNLKKIHNQAASVKTEYSYLWCYYLYLRSLVDDNPIDIKTLTQEVEFYYKSEPQNWRLCWLLSVMAEEYEDGGRRLELFRDAYARGCNSPAIYVEAARIIIDNPAYLDVLDGFNIAIIRYISKKGMMNAEIALVIRSLAEHCKEYSSKLISLFELCYQSYADDEMLGVICTQLIKGNRTDHNAHVWYGYGVERGLKIIRLYDYYMMSIGRDKINEIPRSVLLYFSFQSDLDYETNAILYSYVIEKKDEDAEMYSKYERQIGEFVRDQLRAGHNNRYLSILYKNCIDDDMLTEEGIADRLADVIFTHEIDTSAYPDAAYVILAYDFRDETERYPVKDNVALVPIYSDRYSFAIEDGDGKAHLGNPAEMVRRLISPGRLLLHLQLLVRDHTGIDVNYCMQQHDVYSIRSENEFRFRSLLEKQYFSRDFRQQIVMNMIRFYHDRDKTEELEKILENLESSEIAGLDRPECIRYLAECSQFGKCVEWIYDFGPEGIEKTVIARIVNGWLPTHSDAPEKYAPLVCRLIMDTIDSGYVNQLTIRFLTGHINEQSRILKDIWDRAEALECPVHEFEEKMIAQQLFTGAYVADFNEVLRSYAYGAPGQDVLKAALASACYMYFVREEDLDKTVIEILTDAYETGLEPDRVCNLAYVKYFAGDRSGIDDRTRPILKDCLHRLLADNCVIACFKELSYIMPSMAGYADMEIVEYRSDTDRTVNIHYLNEGSGEDYTQKTMNMVYKGVYSKTFIVFFGETIDYYITEDSEDAQSNFMISGKIRRGDLVAESGRDRFALIDEMCMNRALRNYEPIDALMEKYYSLDYITDRLFSMRRSSRKDG